MRLQLTKFIIILTMTSLFADEQVVFVSAVQPKMGAGVTRVEYERQDGKDRVTGHGSGTFVDVSAYGFEGKNYIITVAHNVMDRDGKIFGSLKVQLPDGVWVRADVVSFDRDLDVCLLRSATEVGSVSQLSDRDSRKGDVVTLIASSKGAAIRNFDGVVSKRFYDGMALSKVLVAFDHGCSGGPLFSGDGRIVGMAVAGVPKGDDLDHSCGLFLPVSCIECFLDEHRKR